MGDKHAIGKFNQHTCTVSLKYFIKQVEIQISYDIHVYQRNINLTIKQNVNAHKFTSMSLYI